MAYDSFFTPLRFFKLFKNCNDVKQTIISQTRKCNIIILYYTLYIYICIYIALPHIEHSKIYKDNIK